MADNVVLNKAASIERCLRRIAEEYGGNRQNLFANQTKQDAIILNQRAQTAGILPTDLATHMQHMVGFRNMAVHEYTRLNLDIIYTIIIKHLEDFRTFSS